MKKLEKNDNSLEIFTLGRFEVRRGDSLISRENQRLSKRWRFFQLLITFKGKALSGEQMIKYLNLEESVNPSEALKSLVFYLRKTLKGEEGIDSCSEQYIISSQGRYMFNEKSKYWLDAEEFEKLCKNAYLAMGESEEKAIELFLKALALYKGNFLSDVPHSHWTIPSRNYYRELFLRAMLVANNLLRKSSRFEEAWGLCEEGLRIVPLEEQLHTSSLQALIDAGKHGLASVQYEEAVALFRENGLNIPVEMKKIGERLKESKKTQAGYGNILEQLQNRRNYEGAYETSVETFSAILDLQKIRKERGESSGHLLIFELGGEWEEEIFVDAGEKLKRILKSSLRKGDVICGWGKDKYIALLINVKQGEVEKIVGRIKEKNKQEIGECPVEIYSRWQEI